MTEKKILEDVVAIRLVLIILLVLYHAFAIFNGAWEKPMGIPDIQAYWWVASFSYSFMLEAFVFISGYILGYQVCKRGKNILSFNSLISKKAKRLLLPGLFFSTIYYALFYDLRKPIGEIFYTILNGSGHLWFLPMLFWCFVGMYTIEKLHLKEIQIFPIALIGSLCSFMPLPFRITSAMHYFLFFYIGYWCSNNKTCIHTYIYPKSAVFSFCLFFLAFSLLTYINKLGGVNNILVYNELVSKIARLFITNAFRIIYSTSGIIMLFITTNLLFKKGILRISPFLLQISTLCFGVYIYQQFILKYLYYYSELTIWCHPIALPWLGFLITLVTSLLFSWLTLRTRFGRFLIG